MAQPEYQINRPTHTAHRKRYRRRSLVLAIILLLLLAAISVVAYSVYRVEHAANKKSLGAAYQQHIAGPQLFTSSYFQFSDSAKWVYAPNDSTLSKLTYLSYASGLPAHSVTVYINQTPLQSDLAVTHVLPVEINNGNSFKVGDISDACSSLYKPTDPKNIRQVALGGTTMLCVPDSPQFSIVVGQVGGDYNLGLKRRSGETANYIILYRNLTANPDPTPFVRIMKTFKAL